MRERVGRRVLGGAGRRVRVSYRDHWSDVAIEVVRAVSALFSVVAVTSSAVLPTGVTAASVLAHLGVVAVSIGVVAVLPAAVRAGWVGRLGFGLTAGTIAFYVVTTALWHEQPGAGSALGVLALLEAPMRYGWRGAALSAPPVLWTALLLPQVDAAGQTMPEGLIVSLVVLLLAAALTVREALRRSIAAVTGAAQGFAEAMLHLPLGVAVLDAHGRVVQGNPALSALLGPVPTDAVLADHLADDAHDELVRVLSGEAVDDQVVCRTRDGREVAVGGATVHVPGPQRVVVHIQDVTDARRERARLLHTSRHDALTGLLTRQAGAELLEAALASGPSVAVLFVDLDGFKRLNDTEGHGVGDTILRQVAGRLSGALRPSEQAVRWGGDEIVVVCASVADDASLTAVAQRLLAVLREPFRVDGLPLVSLTASIGAVRAGSGTGAAAVLAAADGAMYAAKRAGGNRWMKASAGVPAQRRQTDPASGPVSST
jgi:diguanylate cyclase (GGDEF)-like protein